MIITWLTSLGFTLAETVHTKIPGGIVGEFTSPLNLLEGMPIQFNYLLKTEAQISILDLNQQEVETLDLSVEGVSIGEHKMFELQQGEYTVTEDFTVTAEPDSILLQGQRLEIKATFDWKFVAEVDGRHDFFITADVSNLTLEIEGDLTLQSIGEIGASIPIVLATTRFIPANETIKYTAAYTVDLSKSSSIELISDLIYVDDDAEPGGDGSKEHPFQSIQDGIDAAGGDTIIQVATGVYDESLSIPEAVNRLSIHGAGANTTTINGSIAFDERFSGGDIDGFKIRGEINLWGDVLVSDCIVSNPKGIGINCEGTAARIRGNLINGCASHGLRISSRFGETAHLGTQDEPGRNAIYGNQGYDIYSESETTVMAEMNYWGPGTEVNGPDPGGIFGDVDYTPWLTEDQSLPVMISSFTAITDQQVNVILRWTTQSEVNHLGWNIYRRVHPEGEYLKVNSTLIRGHGTAPYDYHLIDDNVKLGQTYDYYLEDVDLAGKKGQSPILQITVGPESEVKVIDQTNITCRPKPRLIPTEFALLQNYPNPFNPETWIPYEIVNDVPVTIKIYNTQGHLIRTLDIGNKPAGIYTTKERAGYWDGRDRLGQKVSSGVYYYTLQAGNFKSTRRMVILK
jgi:hypothetical protein